MFTGIIRALGKISEIKKKDGEVTLKIIVPKKWKVKTGDSIAVNGVCLTVAKINNKMPIFFCQRETIDITNLGYLEKGDEVNLERAMRIGDEFGGHMVQGHVDVTSTCQKVIKIGEGWRYWINIPKKRPKGIVLKGSIALDGISLTISKLTKSAISVDIIPYTYENTNIQFWEKGTIINIETDVIGKYVENYMEALKK